MTEKHSTILLVRNAFSYDFGGGEKFPVILGVQLEKLGYNPIVVSKSDKLLRLAEKHKINTYRGIWWQQQNWSGGRVLFLPIYILWIFLLTLWYIKIITQLQVDILHLQSKDDFIAGTIAGKILRKKVIWTDHADLKDVWRNISIWYKNPVGKIVYICSKMTDAITVVSNNEKVLIEEAIGKKLSKKFTVVYNGAIDSFKEYNHENQEHELSFVLTSRLVIDKGIGEAIDAFKELTVEFPNANLFICGEGPDKQKFIIQAKGIPKIKFLGHIDSVYELLRECDVYVHPSYREGFSLSIVEAAMMGLPIIATKIGGNPEIVTNGINGILISSQNTHELYIAMRDLARSRTIRKNMGRESRRIYLNNFQFDKIVREKFIPLYE